MTDPMFRALVTSIAADIATETLLARIIAGRSLPSILAPLNGRLCRGQEGQALPQRGRYDVDGFVTDN